MSALEGMIGIELFAARNSVTESSVIEQIRAGIYHGKKVDGAWYIVDEFHTDADGVREESKDSVVEASSNPFLANVLFLLSVLSLFGGLFMCFELWPSGYVRSSQKVVAYAPAIQWLVIGGVQSVVLAALGQVLVYLKQIKSCQ